MSSTEHGHGNKVGTSSPDRYPCTVRKIAADSVPYGQSISTNGRYVWAAYDGERLVCIASTSSEARRKYKEIIRRGGAVLNLGRQRL